MEKSLSKFPSRVTSNLFHEMDHSLDDFRQRFPEPKNTFASFDPACEIEERDTSYLLSIHLPGMIHENIRVDMVENVLTISGERLHETSSNIGGIDVESNYGFFQRRFTLPDIVDGRDAKAKYKEKEGVLEVELPKKEIPKSEDVIATTTH